MFHQDLAYFHVDGEQVCTVWIPLDPVDAANGAVRYVRGSHRDRTSFRPNVFVTTESLPGTEGVDVPDHTDDPALVHFDTAPGDIVVHHARTIHGAFANTTPIGHAARCRSGTPVTTRGSASSPVRRRSLTTGRWSRASRSRSRRVRRSGRLRPPELPRAGDRREVERAHRTGRRRAHRGDRVHDAVRGGGVPAAGGARFAGLGAVDRDVEVRMAGDAHPVLAARAARARPVGRAVVVDAGDVLDDERADGRRRCPAPRSGTRPASLPRTCPCPGRRSCARAARRSTCVRDLVELERRATSARMRTIGAHTISSETSSSIIGVWSIGPPNPMTSRTTSGAS